MDIRENISLAAFTTFGIGGCARWFAEAATEDDVVEATAWARERGVGLFVLGGGSNLLVSDDGFDGLVLRVGLRGMSIEDAPGEDGNRIFKAAGGEEWERCVELAVGDDCAGIECLAGIPGTVGGTPVQNVGAYGQEVASVIERVRAFDLVDREWREFMNGECGFSYRRSRFNSTDRGRFLVTRVDYRLTAGGAPTIRYAELEKALSEGRAVGELPRLVEVAAAVRKIRQAKGMLLVDGDADCRSAGSFFKNPVVTEGQLAEIVKSAAKEPPRFPAGPGQVKIAAAWLIEQAGFHKGFRLGRAGISSRHTLALVNFGDASGGAATAAEVLKLAHEIVTAVQSRFGIVLEMEPVMVGFA